MKLNFILFSFKIIFFIDNWIQCKDSCESNLKSIVINNYKTFAKSKIAYGKETGFKQNVRIMISTKLISRKYNDKINILGN